MRFIKPSIPRDEADRLLNWKPLRKRIFPFVKRLLLGPPAKLESRLELVWLPHLILRFRLSETFEAQISVEGISGGANRFEPGTFHLEEREGEEVLPVVLKDDETETIARDSLQRLLMARVHTNPIPDEVTLTGRETLPYPYWVRIHRLSNGKLNMEVLDAVTGKRPGGKTRASILEGFIQLARESE